MEEREMRYNFQFIFLDDFSKIFDEFKGGGYNASQLPGLITKKGESTVYASAQALKPVFKKIVKATKASNKPLIVFLVFRWDFAKKVHAGEFLSFLDNVKKKKKVAFFCSLIFDSIFFGNMNQIFLCRSGNALLMPARRGREKKRAKKLKKLAEIIAVDNFAVDNWRKDYFNVMECIQQVYIPEI